MRFSVRDLPTLNALLNTTSAVLLVVAHRAILRLQIERHRRLMTAAFTISILFLLSYVAYHAQVGSVRFSGPGGVRLLYFAILVSHTVLAASVPPLAGITLYLGWRRRDEKHRRIARWTYPIWLYVSITGVIVYVMLYHLYPPAVLPVK